MDKSSSQTTERTQATRHGADRSSAGAQATGQSGKNPAPHQEAGNAAR